MGRPDITEDDLLALLDYAVITRSRGWSDDDPSALLAPLTDLVPCDFATLTVVDVGGRRTWSGAHPADAMPTELLAAFARHADQHPYVRRYATIGSGTVARISDLTPDREWRRTALYAEHFRPLSVQHQLCALLGVRAGALIGLSFHRSRGEFSDRDRDIVELAQPHIAGAYAESSRLDVLQRRLEAFLPRTPAKADLARLTQREQQVAALIACGLANKQIAAQLKISTRTVHKHVEHIFDKIGVQSRAAVAALERAGFERAEFERAEFERAEFGRTAVNRADGRPA